MGRGPHRKWRFRGQNSQSKFASQIAAKQLQVTKWLLWTLDIVYELGNTLSNSTTNFFSENNLFIVMAPSAKLLLP